MSYLNYLKDELSSRYLHYLILGVVVAFFWYLNKDLALCFFGPFLAGLTVVIASLTMNSYEKYKDKKISLSRSLTMSYADYLKHDLKNKYLNLLPGPIFIGVFLFLCNASWSIIFLYSSGLFVGALMLSAYVKTFYRKF